MARVVLYRRGLRERVHSFSERLEIGRALGNDLVIDDPQLSRHHIRLSCQGGVWWVIDMGARHGILWDGRRLEYEPYPENARLQLSADWSLELKTEEVGAEADGDEIEEQISTTSVADEPVADEPVAAPVADEPVVADEPITADEPSTARAETAVFRTQQESVGALPHSGLEGLQRLEEIFQALSELPLEKTTTLYTRHMLLCEEGAQLTSLLQESLTD